MYSKYVVLWWNGKTKQYSELLDSLQRNCMSATIVPGLRFLVLFVPHRMKPSHYLLFHPPAWNQKREATQQTTHHLPLIHKWITQGTDHPPSCTVDTSPWRGPCSTFHIARRHYMDTIGGETAVPAQAWLLAPFLAEWDPKLPGEMPNSKNTTGYFSTIQCRQDMNRSYWNWPGKRRPLLQLGAGRLGPSPPCASTSTPSSSCLFTFSSTLAENAPGFENI